MPNRINTVFQSLDKAISGDWDVSQSLQKHNNTYNLTNGQVDDILYRTTNKDDYESHKLELQQNKYLNDRWVKANVDLSVQAFAGLNNVKLMYRDADLMDSFPEIGAALNIISEEASLTDPHGQIITVSSKSDRIRAILEDLFVNRLDLQVTAQMIIRGMCKYGNQFMMLNVDHKNGVMGWRQLPVFNVERLENGITNPYGGQGYRLMQNTTEKDDMSTKFIWTDETSEQVPFRNWQIAHFRIIGNSIYLPYGCLVGDTRIETEYGFKEISNIEIGDKVWTFNINTQQRELADVTMRMNKGVKDVYKLKTNHNFIEGTADHKLLCYENEELVYKEIGDIEKGDLIIIDTNIKNSDKPIKIDKTPLPSSRNRGIKWFDKNIDNIPDYVNEEFAEFFGIMLGDGSITNNKLITVAAGVQDYINKKIINTLEKYTNNNVRINYRKDPINCQLLSFSVSSRFLATILHRMGYIDGFNQKRIPSWVYEADEKIKKAFINGLMLADGYCFIDKRRKNASIRCDIELCNEQLIKDLKVLCQTLNYKTSQIYERFRKEEHYVNNKLVRHSSASFVFSFYETQNTQEKCNDVKVRLSNCFKTEKVKSIEYVGKKETFDITVSNDNSNFIANGIITHNCSVLNPARRSWRMLSIMEDMMLIYRLERSVERRVYKIYVGAIDDADVQAYVQDIANNFKRTPIIDPMTGQVDLRKNILDVSQDIFIPVRNESAPNPIDTLPAAQNLTAIDDIKYVQNKVLTALNIPKAFLNFEEAAGNGQNLALMDVRFARRINIIQQAFLMELTKVASIHLYLLGFEDDITNFSLAMTNPSTQAEQLEIDNVTKKIGAVQTAVADPGTGIPIMSLQRALKEIMKWSEKEIQENFEEIRLEKAIANELQMTNQIIQRTGIFDTVDRIFGEPGAQYQQGGQGQGGEDAMGGGGAPPMGGAPSGGDFGEGLDSLGAPGSDNEGDLNGAEGEMPIADAADNGGGGSELPPPMESINKNKPLLNEGRKISNLSKNRTVVERAKIYNDSFLINEEFNTMINSLDEILKDE